MLLYDSPTGGLDPVTSTNIIELIVKQRDVHRTPSLLVTHRLQDAFTALHPSVRHRNTTAWFRFPRARPTPTPPSSCSNEGRLIFDGSLHDLLHSKNPFVREFLE